MSNGVAILSQSDFLNAIDYNPQNESALNNLGLWFTIPQFASPDLEKALLYLGKALEVNPERQDIILNRAVIRIRAGQSEKGCEELKKLEESGYERATIAISRFCKK